MENITELFKKNGYTFSSMDLSIELKKNLLLVFILMQLIFNYFVKY